MAITSYVFLFLFKNITLKNKKSTLYKVDMYKNFNDPIQAFKAESTSLIEFPSRLIKKFIITLPNFLKRNREDNPDRLHGDLK